MRKPIWIVALVLVLMLVGACGGDDDGSEAEDTGAAVQEPAPDDEGDGGALTVTARDFSFDPNQVEVPAGEVTLTFANDGEVPHTITSEALGVDERAAPGGTVEITFTAPDGEAEFHCEIHPGMIGSVTAG
jgi:plastocyanin